LSAERQKEKGRKKDGRKEWNKEKKKKRNNIKIKKKQYFQHNSIFPYYLINSMIFEKKGNLLNLKCTF
jgi:hypothetical protein